MFPFPLRFILWLVFLTSAAAPALAQNAGNVDPGFDPGFGPSNPVYSLAVQGDGKIVIGGNFYYLDGYQVNGFARLNADGSLDQTFNPGGGANNQVLAVALQPDGKVLIGGAFTYINGYYRSGLARLNTDGSVDASFGYYDGANGPVRSIVVQPDGQILVGGDFTYFNDTAVNRIVRVYGDDGSIDYSFYPGQGASEAVSSIALQPDGSVLVGGNFLGFDTYYTGGLVRLSAYGAVDTTFGGSNPPFPNNYVTALLLQPDGKILVGGGFTYIGGASRNGVARLNSDGTVDGSFFDPAGGPNGVVLALGRQPNGNIVIGGDFTGVDGIEGGSIARLLPSGVLDTSYGPGYPANGAVITLRLLPNGETVAAGAFTSIGGVSRDFVARLFQDPTANPVDVSFIRLLSLNGKQFDTNSTVDLTAEASSPGDPITSVALYNNDTVLSQGAQTATQVSAAQFHAPIRKAGKVRQDAVFQQSFAQLSALLVAGLNNLKVVATTQSGAKLTSNVSAITAQAAKTAQKATCQITSPAAGALPVAGAPVQVTVQKAAQAVTVEFYVDSAKGGLNQVQPADQSTSTFTLPALSADRPHYLTAVVTDNGTGISTQSAPVILTPAVTPPVTTPPVVAVVVPGANGGNSATISGSGPALKLKITRAAASGNPADLDLSQPLVVNYKTKGSAKPGINFRLLTGSATIPAGQASVKVKVKPIAGAVGTATVLKFKVLPSGAYTAPSGQTKVHIVD